MPSLSVRVDDVDKVGGAAERGRVVILSWGGTGIGAGAAGKETTTTSVISYWGDCAVEE